MKFLQIFRTVQISPIRNLFSSVKDNLGDIIRDIGAKNPLSKYNFYIKTDNGLDNELLLVI